MTKQCPHAVGKTGCSQDAQEPCPKGYFNCKKVVKDKVRTIPAWFWIGEHSGQYNAVANTNIPDTRGMAQCVITIKEKDWNKLRNNK